MPETYRVADFIADFIADQGVEHVFMLAGGGAMHLNDGLACSTCLQAVPCHHEQAAAIAAEAYGRVHPCGIGVVMVTSGPGATNAITAVAGAWIESIPMLIISGQVKRADLLRGRPLRQMGVQEVEIVPMVKDITKYVKTLEEPTEIEAECRKAIKLAKEGRGGPVWLDIPLDVQGAPFPEQKPLDENTLALNEDVTDLDAVAVDIMNRLKNAERPLLLVGHGVRLDGAQTEVVRFINDLQIPSVFTWNAMDMLEHEHPCYIGRPGVVALRAPNFAVQNCDLLLSIGSRLDNIITAYNPKGFAREAKKIVVDVDPNELDKLEMDLDLRITANAKRILTALNNLQGKKLECDSWRNRCQSWKERYRVNDGEQHPTHGELSHYHFFDVLSDFIPPGVVFSTCSSGLALEVFYMVFRNRKGQRIFLTSGFGAMGYGLPAAIGASFANGRKPMFAVDGEGGLQLNLQELATIRAYQLPICLFVINNGGYCSIRNTQTNYFSKRFVGVGPESGLYLPELKKLAETYGLGYCLIEGAGEVDKQIQSAVKQGPCLVEVKVKNDEILKPKASAVPRGDGTITSMPLEDMSPLLELEQLRKEMLIKITEESEEIRK